MLLIKHPVIAVLSVAEVINTNIMLHKPSVQPGGRWWEGIKHYSTYANDGNKTGYPSVSHYMLNSYWQGDLQGFYTVTAVSVTSTVYLDWAKHQREAIIGVSVHDIECSEGDVTRCGRWPNEDRAGDTIPFNCSHAGPVRFVRIWRDTKDFLSLGEVEVEGQPSTFTGTVFDKMMQQKVSTPTTSLSVTGISDCGTLCHQTQPCIAFSYNPSEQPNCLLATDITMASDVTWGSYKARTCFKTPTCGVRNLL